jgi:hypothetical protein
MAQPTTGTVTLSSSGVSTQIPLDPTARTTSLQLIPGGITSTSTQVPTTVRIEVSLDTFLPAGVTQVWANLSSLTYTLTSSGTLVTPDGAFISVLGPIAACRLNSTSFSSVATGVGSGITLKALQSLTAGP